MGKIRTPYLLLLPGFGFLFTFFILPIVNLAQTSTQTPVGGGDTGQYEQTLRFQNYIDAFVDNKEQFARSFIFAIIATILALMISYPLAYAIAFKAGKFKNFLLVLVVAPFFTSFLLRTVAWKQILGEEGFVVPTLRSLGIISQSTTLTSTSFAVVMGMTYNFLPFMTLPLYASIDRIDPRTLEASGDLYANGFTTFRKVTLPLLLQILSPLLIASFAFNFNNFNLIYLLTGGGPREQLDGEIAGSTDILISYTYQIAFGNNLQDLGLASAISVLIFFIVASISLYGVKKSKVLESFS